MDLKAAYDSVWRKGLLFKLHLLGTGDKFIRLISSMYSGTSACVKMPGVGLTCRFDIELGLKQGCNLSPTLFLCFINDLTDGFEEEWEPLDLADEKVQCLLYADDLVIMSKSEKGLQNAVKYLYDYCVSWQLTVNETKTKVLIFSPGGRLVHAQIPYGSNILDCVTEYEYLGIIFVASGSFARAIEERCLKAERALFALKYWLRELDNPSVSLMKKLVSSLITPVLLYGCDVWGIEALKPTSRVETCNMKFCKFILGVRRNTPNAPCRGELGWFPIADLIKICLVKAYWRLSQATILAATAARAEKIMQDGALKLKSWSHPIMATLQGTGYPVWWEQPPTTGLKPKAKAVRIRLQDQYILSWRREVDNSPRLIFYASVKTTFGPEYYMSNLNRFARSRITRFLCSTHRLRIEVGRHTRPSTPRAARLCERCTDGVIEDELHFLFDCTQHGMARASITGALGLRGARQGPPDNALRAAELFKGSVYSLES